MTDTQHTPESGPGRGREGAGLEATRVRGAMPVAAEGHTGPAASTASAPAHSAGLLYTSPSPREALEFGMP
ncbi:hypothetical protein, partial [Actinotignum timonense]|uniref:hypothetical protein n=1 Tax=Actinotignum timonense TaxID=1870995 RepID=UPI002A81C09D